MVRASVRNKQKGVGELVSRATKETERQLLNLPWIHGAEILSVTLASGINKITHPLGRKYRGRFITHADDNVSTLYDDSTNDQPEKQIWLNFAGTAGTIIDIWIY